MPVERSNDTPIPPHPLLTRRRRRLPVTLAGLFDPSLVWHYGQPGTQARVCVIRAVFVDRPSKVRVHVSASPTSEMLDAEGCFFGAGGVFDVGPPSPAVVELKRHALLVSALVPRFFVWAVRP